MTRPAREDVPDDEKWDPSLIFETPADWEAAADAFETDVDDLRAYEGRATEDGETLLELLDLVEDLKVCRLGAIWLYALLCAYVDTEDDRARERMARYRELKSEMDAALGFLEPELQRAGRDRVSELLETTPGLAGHEAHIERLLAGAEHTLGPEAESVLAELDQDLEAGSEIGRRIAEGDLDHPTVETPDGETVTVTGNTLPDLLRVRDPAFRRRVTERYREAVRAHRHGMAPAYVRRIRADCRRASIRGYDSALAMRLAGRFPVAAYETVVDGIADRLDPYHRLLAARRDRADGDRFREYDVYLPLVPGDPPEVPYGAATELVLDSLAPLGSDYVDRAAAILDERRVDVRPTEHKRRSAKAIHGSTVDHGPFLVLNYDGGLRGLYLFTHELGHAMHRQLAADAQRPVDEPVPDHVLEVASFVHETLLVDHLADTWEGRAARHAQAVFLDKLPLYRAAIGARFVHGLHEAVADGADPGPDALDDRYRELLDRFFAPATVGDGAGTGWQRIDLSRDPYHAYLYAVGAVGSLSVARALGEGDLPPAAYREMLTKGRSVPPVEVFRPTLDLTDDRTVQRGVEAYADRVDRLLDGIGPS